MSTPHARVLPQASLRTLKEGFGWVFEPGAGVEAERRVIALASDLAARLRERVSTELKLLPFGGPVQAQALIDQRNARWEVAWVHGHVNTGAWEGRKAQDVLGVLPFHQQHAACACMHVPVGHAAPS